MIVPTLRGYGQTRHLDPARPAITDAMGGHFSSGFARIVIGSAGHFPQREAAAGTAGRILEWLSQRERTV